jgi:hypothetical protein
MASVLYFFLICLVTLLICLVEGVILTWVRWASFGQSLVSALAANLVSTSLTVLLMVWFDQFNYYYLLLGWLVSFLIDAGILNLFKRQPPWRNLLSSMFANLVSYAVLILPAFYYGQRS